MTDGHRLRHILRLLWALLLIGSASFSMPAQSLDIELELEPDTLYLLPPDSIRKRPPANKAARDWKYLALNRELSLSDTTVVWPKFAGFWIRAYNLVNRIFNDYDKEYVAKAWGGKVILTSDNWLELYSLEPIHAPSLRLSSNIHSDIGIKASYGILSLGYSIDIPTILSDEPSNHKKLDLGFNCARFTANFHYWNNKGPSFIRTYGKVNIFKDNLIKVKFDGLDFSAVEANIHYFFNHSKFHYMAAYGSGYRQLKNAGSAIAGFSYTLNKSNFDFTKLPEEVTGVDGYPLKHYNFDYHSFCISGGYSFNWVCNKHFLFNVTLLPNIGVSISTSTSTTGKRPLLAMGVLHRMALMYSNKRFFCSLMNTFAGNTFLTGKVRYLSGIENFQLSGGIRF